MSVNGRAYGGTDAAAFLHAPGGLERRHDGPLPPQTWEMLRHSSRAAWFDACKADAAALHRSRALRLLASAGRWRRQREPERAAANVAAARQALAAWRDLALTKSSDLALVKRPGQAGEGLPLSRA